MRIRTMELPSEVVGDEVKVPFIFVIDRCLDDPAPDALTDLEDLKAETGACAVFLYSGEVEIDD